MALLQSQSERHIQPGRRRRSSRRDYGARRAHTDALFKFWQEIIFWAILLAGVFFVFYLFHFRGLVEEEAMEIAARGREIALGGNSPGEFVRPLFLNMPRGGELYSSSLIPPLYPWIQAVFLNSGGFSDNSAVVAGSLFFLAAALLTYGLARRILPKKTALFVFLFTFTNPVLLRSAISGLPTTFLVFLLVLILYVREALSPRWFARVGGVVLGVGFLTDFSFFGFLVAAVIYLAITQKGRERWREWGILMAGFLLVISPWLIGQPVGGRNSLLIYLNYYWKSATVLLPGRLADGLFGFSLSAFSLPFSLAIGKIHQGISLLYREGFTLSGNFLALLFWGSFFYRINHKKLREQRLFSGLLLAAGGIWFIFLRQRPEILIPVLPLMILVGVEFFFSLQERFSPRRRFFSSSLTATLIIVNCLPLFYGRVFPDPLRTETLNSLEYLKTLIREEELVVTDIPAEVSWYGNRRAVRLPLNREMLIGMTVEYPEMKFLLLSPRVTIRKDLDPTGEWSRIYLRRNPADLSGLDQILLLPGRLVFMGNKKALLNRVSARW